ncbi:MAG TPA: nuclear transport factor 2 family protein [Solirubrobacteraceae bacterium]|jgi:hypothetical protein|nr:nuclear transport factor 2 family protein [Solirubrobacteraceae bacterium]
MLTGDDYAAISDLYARYNHLADGDDPVAYGDCYAEAGCLVSNGRVIGESRAEIESFRRSVMERPATRRHLSFNLWLEDDGTDRVIGRTYTQSYDISPDGLQLELTHVGATEDVVVLFADRQWRFARRELKFDWIAPSWRT